MPEVVVVINAPLTALSIAKNAPLGEKTPGACTNTWLGIGNKVTLPNVSWADAVMLKEPEVRF